MRITEIQFGAFRSFAALGLPTDSRRVLFFGANGVGKSSTRDVIRYVLTGDAPGLDGKGVGSELLVPDFLGVQNVSASVVIEGIGQVERSWSPTGGRFVVEGFSGGSQVQQEALYTKLGTSKAYLTALLDSRHFLRLHHAEAKALLLELLNVRVEVEGQSYTLEQLDAAYNKAFIDRRHAKAVTRGGPTPELPKWTGSSPCPPLADVEAKLAQRRLELEEGVG